VNVFEKGPFTHMMDMAESLGAGGAWVAFQSIRHTGAANAWRTATRIQSYAASCEMRESIGGADVSPAAFFANPHACFLLMQDGCLHERRFALVFHPGQVVMTRCDETGDAACRALHTEEIVQELAGASGGHRLTLDQGDGQCLDASPLLRRGFDLCWNAGSRQMKTGWTRFFFDPMFGHPERLDWEITDVASLWQIRWLVAEVSLAVLTRFDGMQDHCVRRFQSCEMMAAMTFLPAWLFATFLPHTLRGTHTPIRRGRSVPVLALFGLVPFQVLGMLLQAVQWAGSLL
jgi:hypothetical protein